MRILILDQFSDPGGAQLCVRDLGPEIRLRGWKATFLAPGDGAIRSALAELGIPGERLPGGNYTNGEKNLRDVWRYGVDTIRALRKTRELVERKAPDLIYVNGPRVLPLATLTGLPMVFHAHSYLSKQYARRVARACIRIGRARVIAASRFAAGPIEGAPVRVIYSGVQDQGFAHRTTALRIGIIGRIAPEKGQLDFVRAAKRIAASRKYACFVVFGKALFADDDYFRRVRSEAADLPVRFAGWTQDVSRALREIDVLAAPSSAIDAAPRVVMEALSAGVPVVAYPSGGIPELIRDGETGLLTERATPESFADRIRELIGNPRLLSRLSEAGRCEWERRFRIERFQTEVCDFLERREVQSAAAVAGEENFS